MNELMAKLSAVASVVLVIGAIVALYVTSSPGLSGTAVKAEFEDAYPLLEGMHVREYGAVAGSVSEIEVTDQGTALITMQLHEGTDPPQRDAIATIRQEDITGDSYVSLSPGDDPEPLGDEVIPTERTMSAPRFDDLLNSFNEPVRQGLELTLVELGVTLESRGEDLNRAALELRPTLEATNRLLTEVNSENASLRALIGDAERVTSQAASRSRELERLVAGLATTLETTAAHAPALDAGLDNAPETLAQAERTLAKLATLTEEGLPLAISLRSMAPQLAETARLLSPFLDDTGLILDDIEPTLDLTRKLFVASEPTLAANPKRVFTAPFDVASGIGELLSTLVGDPDLMKALFGADTYGGELPGDASDDVGLGAISVERGTQAAYPDDYDPMRRFVRATIVPSCETFGRPNVPGCLREAIADARGGGSGPDPRGGDGRDGGGAGPADGGEQPAAPGPGDAAGPHGLGDQLESLGDELQQAVDEITSNLGVANRDRGRNLGLRPEDVDAVLDLLLGP